MAVIITWVVVAINEIPAKNIIYIAVAVIIDAIICGFTWIHPKQALQIEVRPIDP